MHKNENKITVLGGGISGLATAYWLDKAGLDITVLEASGEPGGSMITRREDGFLIDYGANSGLDTTPLIGQMVADLGLADDIVYANETGNKRYILKDQRLHALPTSPLAFIRTKLFSSKAKLRLVAEPFIGRSEDGYYQSISQFVKRRLGQEFLDYAVNPFVAGVFAGNPDDLSVKSAFPKLYRLEEVYGGLFKGLIKGARERKQQTEQSKRSAKMFSFNGGMQVLPEAIAVKLKSNIKLKCSVEKVLNYKGRYKISYRHDGKPEELESDVVVSAIPAYHAASVLGGLDTHLLTHLKHIYYPPVKVLYLGFRVADVKQALDGFGFLIPAKEKKKFLGAIWSSTIFPFRSKEGMAAFTLFVGGARSPELLAHDDNRLIEDVINEFQEIMRIKEKPVLIRERMWPQSIPQYQIGHIEHERYFEQFETNNPGVFLSGNYRGGISVADCIKNSHLNYLRIVEFLESSDHIPPHTSI